MKSFLDMEVLARGCKIEEDTLSVPQNTYVPQPVQPPPVVLPIPPTENKAQNTYKAPEKYIFWEEEHDYEIHVMIRNQSQSNETEYQHIVCNHKFNGTDICLTYFLVDSIKKIITEGLEKDDIQFLIQCRYYDTSLRQEQVFEFIIDEETLSGNHLVQAVKKAFGSRLSPFPPKKGIDFNNLLSKYLIDRFHEKSREERIFFHPNLNDISDLSEPERKSMVKLFYKIYHNTSCEVKFLLSAGFGAVCCNKFDLLKSEMIPDITKTIVIYNCKSSEQQKLVNALISTSSNRTEIMKLSEIKITAKQDELKQIFFKHQYQPLVFLDDTISDYAKKQNIEKIQRITEYISNGIQRTEKTDIPSTGVVFTNRKLSEFRAFSDDCIFINAENIPEQDYDNADIQIIVSDFLSLLYENIDYYFESESKNINHIINNTFCIDASQSKIISLCEIYHFIVQSLSNNYGIGNAEEEIVLNCTLKRKRKSVAQFLNENRLLLSDETITDNFIDKINCLIHNRNLKVKLYDRNLTAVGQTLLYEHLGQAVLLFSNEYFEKLFASPVVENKQLRKLLDEYGYMMVNCMEKCCFRLPIDERKLYTAIKINALDEQAKEILPNLHPVFIPDMNDGIDRILLANDEYGKPRYWSVGKMENKSVLIQGATRKGKTYFTTTKLIMGLHQLGYRVIIFESAIPSYGQHELGKCGYDEIFISENFYHGESETACEIMNEFENTQNKIYIVNSETGSSEKQKLCDLLFKYQKNEFKENLENTVPLFIVFEEAGDISFTNAPELKRIYNQGSKMKLSTITVLQMFLGEGSKNFRKMVCQASLKVSFECGTDGIKYFIEAIPSEMQETAAVRLPKLNMGEAVICGEFENPDGSLHTGGFIARKD